MKSFPLLKRRLRSLLLPAASALLGFISFPAMGIGWAAWFSLAPLILFTLRSNGIREVFWGGVITGALQSFALLIWIPRVLIQFGGMAVPLAWFLFILLCLFLGIYPGFACASTKYCILRAGYKWLFVFPFAWITMEYLRVYTPFEGFPWLLLGYSQSDWLSLIQVADLAGVFGVSFLIAAVNAALVWFLVGNRRVFHGLGPLLVTVLGVCACLFYGTICLSRWSRAPKDLGVAILQGDISFEEPDNLNTWKFQNGYVQMADGLKPGTVDLLLLPESPSPLSFQYDSEYRKTMQNLARRFSMGLVLNNIRYQETTDKPNYFNSAYFVDRDGTEVGHYDKVHLVPFGEYIPWRRLFFFAETISKDVSDFQAGGKLETFPLGSHRGNVIICFEAIFPNLVREFVRDGSQLIINLTNDRWYGDSAAPFQHLAMARWRAIENRRYLLRAANSGVSAVITPAGELQVRTDILKPAICMGRFSFLSNESFYARHGSVFATACAIIMVLLILLASVPLKSKGQGAS